MSQRVEEIKQTVNNSLSDSTKPWKAAFDFVEEKTGVPRLYLFSGKYLEDILFFLTPTQFNYKMTSFLLTKILEAHNLPARFVFKVESPETRIWNRCR